MNFVFSAMYDTGLGPCKLNDLLSCFNIPTVKPSSLKIYEEELSVTIQECANDSFENAIQIEKELTREAEHSEEVK